MMLVAGKDRHLHSKPSGRGLARLAAAVAPGSRVVAVRRLRGGQSTPTHAIELATPAGGRQWVVVRRFGRANLRYDPDVARHEFDILRFLEKAPLPVPRPVLLDESGSIFGTPAIVMTRLAGAGVLEPPDVHRWARQLGRALAAVHRLPVASMPRQLVPRPQRWLTEWQLRDPPHHLAGDRLAAAIWPALRRRERELTTGSHVLVHNDYWAGNTLWHAGKLTGIVDWGSAAFGPAGLDVGYCRLDLTLQHGPQVATTFLRAYETAVGEAVTRVAPWDLVAAIRALPDPATWISSYEQFDRSDLTPRLVRSRFGKFLLAALEHAS